MAKAKKPVKKLVKKSPVKKVAKVKPAPKIKAKAAKIKAKPLVKAAKKPVVAKPQPVPTSPAAKVAKVKPEKKPAKNAKASSADKPPEDLEAPVESATPPEEVVLTDAEGRRYCRVKDCDQLASVDIYCRYHYLLYWKRIQVRKKILTEGKLERYIEDLTARYPDKFLDMLRKDLRSEKEFLAAIQELEIDESQNEGEFEDENENFIDEVRGMTEPVERSDDEF